MGDGPTKNQFSRRDFMKTAAVIGGGLVFGEIFDQAFLNGYVTNNLHRAIVDPQYRERLLQTITSGRLKDKLALEVQERRRPYSEVCGLGETLNLRENLLDKGFEEYSVRPFITNGEITNNLLMIGKLGKNIKIYQTVKEPNYRKCLEQTMKEQGEFITIPSPYTGLDTRTFQNGMFANKIDTYSEYQTESGFVQYSLDKLDQAYGALILQYDGSVKAVDRAEIPKYVAGWNCQALQSYGVAINSETLESDLSSLDQTEYNDGRDAAVSRNQSCLIVTFSDSLRKREETVVISLYQHYDSQTQQFTGDKWKLGLSMEQTASLCEQIALEKQYDKFVILGPDPTHNHSCLNAPSDLGNTRLLRKYSYSENVFFREDGNEATNQAPSYEAPIFLGINLQ